MVASNCQRCGCQVPVEDGLIQYAAPYCDDCVEALRAEAVQKLAARASQQRAAEWRRLCPPIFLKTDPSRLPTVQLRRVLAWQFSPRGLILQGLTRTAKTRCLYVLLERLYVAEGRTVEILAPGELETRYTAAFRDEHHGIDRLFAALTQCDVLAVDDLGKDRWTDRYTTFLFAVLNKRTEWERPILCTTNEDSTTLPLRLSSDTDGQSFTQPLVERLREFCETIRF